MRITLARVRLWIVLFAVLLVAALAGFYVQLRMKARHLVSDLPGKLGLSIEQTSDSYTLSQTGKNGRTSFTLKASKAIKFKDGNHYTLRDVVITIYGAQGDRNDRISGKEFNYDPKTGIIAAQGAVQIDMRGADLTGSTATNTASEQSKDESDANVQDAVHVDTSGLVFNQKAQVANTTQYVAFHTPKASGHATGATYDVQKGLLVLDTRVEIASLRDGKPIMLHATHAEFLHNSMQAFLIHPSTDYETDHVSTDQAIVYFRKDASAEHIDAEGHFHLKTDDGQDMTSHTAKLLLDQKSALQRALLSGGINFVSTPAPADVNAHLLRGNAVEGTVEFAPNGTLHHAQARNAVSFVDQQRGLTGDPQGSTTRELRAAQVDIDFSQNSEGRAIADKVLAVGGAAAVLHTTPTKGPGESTTVKGDQLLAKLLNGKAIASLHGTGHTSVLDTSPTGASNLSTGDVLQVTFAPGRTTPQVRELPKQQHDDLALGSGSGQIQTFSQQGNVAINQTPASGASGAPSHATAQRADYTAGNQLLRLTGSPRIDDGATDLAATTIDFHRDTSIANARGNVKATYLQPKKSGPGTSAQSPVGFGGQGLTHVVANDAVLNQIDGVATFTGQARLWQGSNSVAAPVIEIHRNPERLKAYGDSANPGAVFTVIANASSPQRQADVARVRSRQLLYLDSDRKALFSGTVTSEDATGTVHCDQAEVFLAAANPALGNSTAAEAGQSRIDRIVATGNVVLQQPGRRGTGEKLLYTGQDGKFVLTGTSALPPHLYDQTHGNVFGDALIFNSRDDSVSVTGGQSKAVTDTRTAK